MQKFIRIHDKVNQYKGSCSLPIHSITLLEDNDEVQISFYENDYDYIFNCISKLEGVYFRKGAIRFNLKDYHFTVYID